MLVAARVILAVVGALGLLSGLVQIQANGAGFPNLLMVPVGSAILIALLLERPRYRSVDSDLRNAPGGPGGGEPVGALPAGFRATAEVFVDPTSGRLMRVFLQPATGDRRYVAED
jgi:hypothetical protein